MPQKIDLAESVTVTSNVVAAADINRNQVKIRIAFIGPGRQCNVDLDSLSCCKTNMSGPLFPADLALVAAITKLITDAKDTYPPGP